MKSLALTATLLLLSLAAATPGARPSAQTAQPQQPAFEEWADGFEGSALDESKWERFSFEGAGGGKLEVKEGELRIRSLGGSRAGVRSRQTFTGDRFSVEAKVARVGQQVLLPGDKGSPLSKPDLP